MYIYIYIHIFSFQLFYQLEGRNMSATALGQFASDTGRIVLCLPI